MREAGSESEQRRRVCAAGRSPEPEWDFPLVTAVLEAFPSPHALSSSRRYKAQVRTGLLGELVYTASPVKLPQ
jgi:hypothetical protein